MFTLRGIGRLGASLRNSRRNRLTIREMNALPPELQRDIGWPASAEARAAGNVRDAWWEALG